MNDTPSVARTAPLRSAFFPMLLMACALIGWLGLLGHQLIQERLQLQQLVAGQQPQIDNAQRLRSSLDRLALSTQQLATDGNPNARALVDELRRRGVTIDAGASNLAQR